MKADLMTANRIARAVGGELPSINSDFSPLKGPYDIWTRAGIAVPKKSVSKDGSVLDEGSMISFQPHSNFKERLEEYRGKHPDASPAYLFETANGDGWTSYPSSGNRARLHPGKEHLVNIGICGIKEISPGVFQLLLDGPLGLPEAGSQTFRMYMNEDIWNRTAIVMPLTLIGDSGHDAKYPHASDPKTEKEVAVQVRLDLLLERLGETMDSLKTMLNKQIYYSVKALMAEAERRIFG